MKGWMQYAWRFHVRWWIVDALMGVGMWLTHLGTSMVKGYGEEVGT